MKIQTASRLDPLLLIVANENDTSAELKDLVNILYNLRLSTLKWELKYGSDTRKQKKYWEQKADTFINNHVKIDNEN